MIPFSFARKRIKHPEINYLKRQKSCVQKTDTDERNQRQRKKVETYIIFLDWKNQNCQNDYTT